MVRPLVVLSFALLGLSARGITPTCETPPAPQEAQAPGPTFMPEDPGQLEAKIKGVKPIIKRKAGALLWIQVTNRSSYAAEPLTFRLTPKTKGSTPVLVRRMPAPYYGRAGRVVPPGGKVEYPVIVSAQAATLKRAQVEVVDASFVDGLDPFPEPDVVVGKPKTAGRFRDEWKMTFDHTTAMLTNRTQLAVDLTYRAKFTGRYKGEGLIFASLEPGEKREIEWKSIPLELPHRALPSVQILGVEFKKLELVDWSVRVEDGNELGAELLEAAWQRRAHLEDAQLNWSTPAKVSLLGKNRVEEVPCRLGFDDAGKLRVVEPGALRGGALSEVNKYLPRIQVPSALRKLPEVGPDLTLERWGPEVTLGHRNRSQRYIILADEAIVYRGFYMDRSGGGETWTHREVDEGWLLKHIVYINGAYETDFEYTWTDMDGRWFPKRISIKGQAAGYGLWPPSLVIDFEGWGK